MFQKILLMKVFVLILLSSSLKESIIDRFCIIPIDMSENLDDMNMRKTV